MAAPARAPRDGDFQKPGICPKGACDMIAEAVPIEEDLSTEKENGAKSDAPFLLIDILN